MIEQFKEWLDFQKRERAPKTEAEIVEAKQLQEWMFRAGISASPLPHRTEQIEIRLTNRQFANWESRDKIIQEELEAANPEMAIVRDTLAATAPGPNFGTVAAEAPSPGKKRAILNYLAAPQKLNLTREGEIQSNASRLPSSARDALEIDGNPVVQLDIKAAHPCLLGMFYAGESLSNHPRRSF